MKHILFFALLVLFSCQEKPVTTIESTSSLNSSDDAAIALANQVMDAMGGQQAWDNTHLFKWTFFGRRTHIWDKQNQISKINVPSQEVEYLLDISDMTGTVKRKGEILSDQDSVDHYLEQARRMWINDSYWLFMPFKLQDEGVTLKMADPDTTQIGTLSDRIEMTFESVGVTPENKYIVYVDQESKLITQWDFYTNYTDSLPRFQSAWPDYNRYGDLLLSGGAMGTNAISDIEVSAELSELLSIE